MRPTSTAGPQPTQFYRDNTLLFSFTPSNFVKLVGTCPGATFCGNPSANFPGGDSGQQYAYLNFYDSNGSFNRITLSESGARGFESGNHAVAVLSSAPGGTPIATPEPGTAAIVGFGLMRPRSAPAAAAVLVPVTADHQFMPVRSV